MNDQNNMNNQDNNSSFLSPLHPVNVMPKEEVSNHSFFDNSTVPNNGYNRGAPLQNTVVEQTAPIMGAQVVGSQNMQQEMNNYNQYQQNTNTNYEQVGGQESSEIPNPDEKPKKGNKAILIICILIPLLIIIGFVAIILMSTSSVSSQIDKTRSKIFIQTASQYISEAKIIVESETTIDNDTLLLIPGGNKSDKSMLLIESGGSSPFNPEYYYAYVLVERINNENVYYFVASDASNKGIVFVSENELKEANATDYVHSNMDTEKNGIGSCHNLLKEKYSNTQVENGDINSLKECTNKMMLRNKTIKKYVICSNTSCK